MKDRDIAGNFVGAVGCDPVGVVYRTAPCNLANIASGRHCMGVAHRSLVDSVRIRTIVVPLDQGTSFQ